MKYFFLGLNLLKFAVNNLKRSPGRTLMLSVSIGLTTMMINLIIAFYVGLNSQIINSVVQANVGNFQILAKDPTSVNVLTLKQHNFLQEKFTSSVSQLVSNGFITTTEGNSAIQLVGDDFKFLHDSKVMKQDHSTLSGGVIIGKQLALDYKLNVGDTFIYNYQTKSDELMSELLMVEAIHEWNSMDFQSKFVYAPRWRVAELLETPGVADLAYQRIVLRTNRPKVLSEELKKNFNSEDVVIKTWEDINPEMATVVEFNGSLKGVLLLIIGFTVIITILTPVNVTWNERFPELRSLNVLGMTVPVMRTIGMFEALILGLGIGLLSTILSLSIIEVFFRVGIDISFMNGGQVVERAGIELPTIIYPLATLENLILSFLFPLPIVIICYFQAMNLPFRKLKASLK